MQPSARHHPRLIEAAMAMNDNRLHDAEPLLKQHLKADPFDVFAIRMLAELAGRIGRYRDSENLLRRAVELAPGFTAARANLALVLYRLNKPTEAIAELDQLLTEDPDNIGSANLKAAALGRIGGYEDAITLYESVLATAPKQPKVWMSYGHMLKTVGRQAEGVAAYRKALDLIPGLGEAWWSLANLKTVKFDGADIAAMEQQLARSDIEDEDRFHLDFALGKALEDHGDPEGAFAHYAEANRLRRTRIRYSADEAEAFVDRSIARYTRDFLDSRKGQGCDAPDPIFILGMPRAGSTLIEQILSSHPLVEGTSELNDIPALSRQIDSGGAYPDGVEKLSPEQLRAMGEDYLRRARVQRYTDKPYFIDKLPNNWAHLPLIHLILPNAKIVDARRHPLGCCFSNFKQHYARGQLFSYDLSDMGRYYRGYVRLMAHIDDVRPGLVHRVIYERMVDDTEAEVRALLAALGLDFYPACLEFHKTERAVRTASSEQVRRPIYREGTEGWQPYDRWLDPLKDALGDVLTEYPAVPAFG